MSKTYFGRCAAVGIAGLTAMSTVAMVSSAATQASLIYELQYKGVNSIGMLNTAGYATGTNKYCVSTTVGTNAKMNSGFVVDFTRMATVGATEIPYTLSTKATDPQSGQEYIKTTTAYLTAANVWNSTTNFKPDGVNFDASNVWTYKEYDANYTLTAATLNEIYSLRNTITTFYRFKTDADRLAAKRNIMNKLTSDYNTLANRAYTQFVKDVDAQVAIALEFIKTEYEDDYDDAMLLTGLDRTAALNTAQSLRSVAESTVRTRADTIKNEFRNAFTANNFRIETDGFASYEAAITFDSSFAGVTTTAKFTSNETGSTAKPLNGAKYYNATTKYVNPTSYAFRGEIQLSDDYVVANAGALCINGNDWINFEVIDYSANSGGNTTPSGGTTTGGSTGSDNTTTTTTTWYPDSAAYRAASEVSYRGENGYWYTSASAASTYGGGYTGTSKNSNFSSVSSANSGKTIYFDASTGTYTTGATSYSYVVKEGSSTSNNSDDPYYTYFFGNGNKNNTTTTTVPAGSPAISGASKYAGWTNISAYITNRGKSGSTYTINMNEGTVVPAAVLAAAKSKNVTLVFANKNGSKVTVKPGKVDTTSDLNVAVTYNVKDVKTSLVNKAKKINAGTVSTAQIRVGTEGAIGGTETVTVKFSTKRAGCTVKAYRLTASGSLKKEATGTVSSTGRVNLNLTKGGSYLLVVVD